MLRNYAPTMEIASNSTWYFSVSYKMNNKSLIFCKPAVLSSLKYFIACKASNLPKKILSAHKSFTYKLTDFTYAKRLLNVMSNK